jgi:hypothetical protein
MLAHPPIAGTAIAHARMSSRVPATNGSEQGSFSGTRRARREREVLDRVLAFGLVLGLCACARTLPGPRIGPQPDSAFIEVPYPPPPARVEVIPARPRAGAVWTDGQWLWLGDRWVWSPGGWVAPPAGAWFAPWAVARASDGRLRFAPPSWHAADGREIPAPALLAPAIGEQAMRAVRCP